MRDTPHLSLSFSLTLICYCRRCCRGRGRSRRLECPPGRPYARPSKQRVVVSSSLRVLIKSIL